MVPFNFTYLSTADLIEKLVNYQRDSSTTLEARFNAALNLRDLRTDMKDALLKALNTRSEDFDPGQFRALLAGTLSRMNLPVLQIVQSDAISSISSQFSGDERDSKKMKVMQQAHKDAVESIRRELLASFEEAVAGLRQQLGAVSQTLAAEFAQDLEKERQQLKAAFADKDRELAVYADIVAYCLKQTVAR